MAARTCVISGGTVTVGMFVDTGFGAGVFLGVVGLGFLRLGCSASVRSMTGFFQRSGYMRLQVFFLGTWVAGCAGEAFLVAAAGDTCLALLAVAFAGDLVVFVAAGDALEGLFDVAAA